jgi:hypothetical protein
MIDWARPKGRRPDPPEAHDYGGLLEILVTLLLCVIAFVFAAVMLS